MKTSPRASQRVPHAVGWLARQAFARAREAGLALPPLLRHSNLTAVQMRDPTVNVPVRDQIRLVNLVAEALDDDLLGFHLAQHAELREIGLLYYVLASSETVVDALRRATRYVTLVNEGAQQRCSVGREIEVTLRYVGVGRHVDRHQAEFWMTLLIRMLRTLTCDRVVPRALRFVHPRETRFAELDAFFGTEPAFGAGLDQITFDLEVGRARVASADPYLNRLLVRYCEEALAHRRSVRDSFRASVENAVVPLLPHAEVRAATIACQLGVSQRTLARRLAEEDDTFSGLVERLRRDLGERYLADEGLSVSQVAWLLGYQGVAAFSKAYKRWTGQSPRAARRERVRSSRDQE